MKNKHFYYTKEQISHSKMYGNTTYCLTIYGIKKNQIYNIGECGQNSGSTCGDIGECWQVMQKAGEAPKSIDVFKKMYTYLQNNNISIEQI